MVGFSDVAKSRAPPSINTPLNRQASAKLLEQAFIQSAARTRPRPPPLGPGGTAARHRGRQCEGRGAGVLVGMCGSVSVAGLLVLAGCAQGAAGRRSLVAGYMKREAVNR